MFLSVLLHLDVVSNRKSCSRLRFILQIATFFSGAEGVRTPDLRRAKAARYFARGFWSLQNACKLLYFCFDAILSMSGDLLGLRHDCCTRAEECHRRVAAVFRITTTRRMLRCSQPVHRPETPSISRIMAT